MTPETESGGEKEEGSMEQAMPPAETGEQAAPAMESGETAQAQPQPEGKRTQLKIVRENIEGLSRDVGSFRRSHEVSAKTLEAHIASLRKELSSFAKSKDVDKLSKSHHTSSAKLEKQVASLRAEVAALKSHISKEAARGRAKEEATLARILAKVSTKPKAAKAAKPAKPKPKAKAKPAKPAKK